MAAITQKIGNLIGGVSQQPDTVKFNGQLRACDNYYPDVATGLTKRPGLQGIGKLANAVNDGTWFMVFRDDQEKYVIQFSKAGALKIWSVNSGHEQTVNPVAAESTAYATHAVNEDLQILQINDYIFVLNRTKTVLPDTATSSSSSPYAFVTINTIAYKSTYTITLDGTDFTYTTVEATTSGTSNQLNVKDIVDNLITAINGNVTWVAEGIGNNIYIRKADNSNFSIEAQGGNAGTSIEAYKGSVISPAQLPKEFINNLKIKVSGSNDTGADDYWVQFKTVDNTASGNGVWEETIAPDTVTGLDVDTMPHVIIREADGTFTYRSLNEADAQASSGTIPVAGVPTSVTILSATSGGHVVDEQFSVSGGTGTNLRLKVTKVKTDTVTQFFAATSSTYVRRVAVSFFLGIKYDYIWYENDVQIGITSGQTFTLNNKTFTVDGAFQTINNQSRAGVKVVSTLTGVIDGISILQSGQGYTASDVVSNASNDTFTIVTVETQLKAGDAARLNYWKPRVVGDADTNPMPSFVENPIDSISFFKNRLILTSRGNVVCSQAGDYFNFFAATVITILDSDPIDLSAGSLKPIRFKNALASSRGLLLFADNGQYILETTTEAFSPKTAEINRLSAYSADDSVTPVDIGSSYLFIEEGEKASSIYEMNVGTVGSNPTVVELTRLIPTYIPAGVDSMKGSSAIGLVSILSKQEDDKLYLYRWFQNGEQSRISAWFRWHLPGNIESFDFDQDIMFVVSKIGSSYVLSKMSLLTDTPAESLLFEGNYLDVRLDFFDYSPVVSYNPATDLTYIYFKEGFETMDEQPVLVYLEPSKAGYFEERPMHYEPNNNPGQQYFITVEGDQTADKFAIGYKYQALATLPAFYFVKDVGSANKDTVNIPRVSRVRINSYNSGPYKTVTRIVGRPEFELYLPQIAANSYNANALPIVRNAQSVVPVMAKGDQVEMDIIVESPFPTSFTSLDWEGTYDNKGIQSL